MVIHQSDFQEKRVERAKGGEGSVLFRHLVQGDAAPENLSLCARIEFSPGDSVGYHVHEGEAELYLVIEGEFEVDDDHEGTKILHVGDAMLTASGHGHSIANKSDKPASIWAMIVKS